MKSLRLFLSALATLLLFSGCNDYYTEHYSERAFNVLNMKVGSDTSMALYLNDEYYPTIDYQYDYGEIQDYYLNIGHDSFADIYLQSRHQDDVVSEYLDAHDQTMVIFGADVQIGDEYLNIPMQIRMFEDERPRYKDAATINLINALPSEPFSNFLPYLGFESTLFLEVNGYRVSRNVDYMQNDRFAIEGVYGSHGSVPVNLVLSDGSVYMYDMALRNGHSYNLIVGHLYNTLSSEPTIYMYDVTF